MIDEPGEITKELWGQMSDLPPWRWEVVDTSDWVRTDVGWIRRELSEGDKAMFRRMWDGNKTPDA